MLSRDEIKRREELTFKLRDKTLNYDEAIELQRILEKEKEKAISLNDLAALLAIGFFTTALIAFLSGFDKKKKKKKSS